MEKPERNITKKRMEHLAMDKAKTKRDKFGSLALTAQDQRDLRGIPSKDLSGDNEGKAEYEIMTNEQILEYLDEAVMYKDNPEIGHTFKDRLKASIPFLKNVGKLPEKYKDFDTNKL